MQYHMKKWRNDVIRCKKLNNKTIQNLSLFLVLIKSWFMLCDIFFDAIIMINNSSVFVYYELFHLYVTQKCYWELKTQPSCQKIRQSEILLTTLVFRDHAKIMTMYLMVSVALLWNQLIDYRVLSSQNWLHVDVRSSLIIFVATQRSLTNQRREKAALGVAGATASRGSEMHRRW